MKLLIYQNLRKDVFIITNKLWNI